MQSLAPHSFWNESVQNGVTYPPLSEGIRADVAILGAGITGLTAALQLKRAGRRVVVLEANRVGSGTTGGTTAHLDVLPDQGTEKLIKDFGESGARHLTDARRAAIDHIERLSQELGIDCDFRRVPAYLYTERDDRASNLEKECDAARRLGVEAAMSREIGLPFPVAGAVRFENQARFHPQHYLRALARAVHGDGCAIYEHTLAETPSDGAPCTVATRSLLDGRAGVVKADQVIIATHSAFLGISQFDMRMAPYQSYVVAAVTAEPPPDALYWDDADPYHYTRWADSNKPGLLLIGGADHKTGHDDPADSLRALEDYVRQRFRVQAIERHWSAEFFEPADGAPFIGRVPTYKNTYLATGFSGTGMTYGVAAALLLADLLQGREPPLAAVVSPSRFKAKAEAKDLIVENLDVAKQYVADRFAGEKIQSFDEIATGEGRLVSYEGEQLAVYRDNNGELFVLSPACTHAGCHVRWNGVERTWDCPCHGGRYTAQGERLYGPPPKDLENKTPQMAENP